MAARRIHLCRHRHQLVPHHFIGPAGTLAHATPPYSATLRWPRHRAHLPVKVPTNPSSNLNIGMLGGSEVVNAKAADAWFTVDFCVRRTMA